MKEKYLKCVACERVSVIQRKDSKDRPAGHIKHLWCPRCKERRPHIELDEFESSFSKNMELEEQELKAIAKGASYD